MIHHDKLKDLKGPVSTRNRSIVIPKTKEEKHEIPDTQMVTEYFD